MKKIDVKIISSLITYFDGEVIGSYMLVEKGLLDLQSINDIDIQIPMEKIANAHRFMEDNGYNQTIKEGRQIGYENGRCIMERKPQGDFKRGEEFDIDIVLKSESVYKIEDLIKIKFQGGRISDLKQIIEVCDLMIKNKDK